MLILSRRKGEQISIADDAVVLTVDSINVGLIDLHVNIPGSGVEFITPLRTDDALDLMISSDTVTVKLIRATDRVRIGIGAPRELPVMRRELLELNNAQTA